MTNEAPVLIVGGGGAGLTCSMLLSTLGVEHLLVSRAADHVDPAQGARAQSAHHGDPRRRRRRRADLCQEHARREHGYMGWYAGFAGADPDFGRLIAKIETWGCGYTNLNWVQASPCRSANLPQIRLEPIMKARAEELNPGKVRFHHELIGLEQDGDGVTARIKNHDTGDEYTVRRRYLLGCDGGRTIPRMVGIDYEGLGVLAQTATAHVSADLSKLARGPGRADPLDLVSRHRRDGGARADGAGPLGSGQRRVGLPRHLSGRRPEDSDGRADRKEHARWRSASAICR